MPSLPLPPCICFVYIMYKVGGTADKVSGVESGRLKVHKCENLILSSDYRTTVLRLIKLSDAALF